MKFKNLDAFGAALKIAVTKAVEKDVVPIYKGVVLEAAAALVTGDFRYAGTPEWSGNAAANWWPSMGAPGGDFIEFFNDVPYEKDAKNSSPYNGTDAQRAGATSLSLERVRTYLASLQGIPREPIFITNTAPYLASYQPYGDGAKFRTENLWPLSALRAAVFMNQRVASASQDQLQAWKQGFK
jgi:hypothetical protein